MFKWFILEWSDPCVGLFVAMEHAPAPITRCLDIMLVCHWGNRPSYVLMLCPNAPKQTKYGGVWTEIKAGAQPEMLL